MPRRSLLPFLAALGLAGSAALAAGAAAPGAPSPRWGINGHPLSQAPYFDIPLERQLDLVAELGAGWYRFDLDANAYRAQTARVDALLLAASRRGIRLLPILMSAPGFRTPGAAPEQVRQAAREFGQAVAGRYHGRITHWELENEPDFFAMIRRGEVDRQGRKWDWDGAPEGSAPQDYEEARYQLVKAEILGLREGIMRADPSALTIVDTAGWLHTGIVTRLVTEDHVPFDILAWHWYSEMGPITNVGGSIDLVARLAEFGRPLWITEVSRRLGSAGGKEAELAHYVSSDIAAMGRDPRIGAVMVYELLDEPYVGDDTRYGLVSVTRDQGQRWVIGQRKAAFAALQGAIAEEAAAAPPHATVLRPK